MDELNLNLNSISYQSRYYLSQLSKAIEKIPDPNRATRYQEITIDGLMGTVVLKVPEITFAKAYACAEASA